MWTSPFKSVMDLFLLPVCALLVFTSWAQAQYVTSNSSVSSLDNISTYRLGVGNINFTVHPAGEIKLTPDGDLYSLHHDDLRFYYGPDREKYVDNNGIKIPKSQSVGFYQVAHLDDIVFIEISDASDTSQKRILLAMSTEKRGNRHYKFKLVTPRGATHTGRLEMRPEEFIAYERKDWLINRRIGFGEHTLTINHSNSEIAYQPQSVFLAQQEDAARNRIIAKVGIQLGDKYISSSCTALASGYSFQSAGRELYNKGKAIDVFYEDGRCNIKLVFGRSDQVFISSDPEKFKCTDNTCTFPMSIYQSPNGRRVLVAGRKWIITVLKNASGEYELQKIDG